MEFSLEQLYLRLIDFLERQDNLNIPYLITKGQIFTKQDIINELKNQTPLCQVFLNDMILLAVDMLSRGKEKTPNFELAPPENNQINEKGN